MQNVLVTGGAGFIGSNFVRYLLKQDPTVQVINFDVLTYAGSIENLKGLPDADRHTFIHDDIRDTDALADVFESFEIDTIVHFAAETHVDRSILGPAIFIESNILGTFNLLEVARKNWSGHSHQGQHAFRFHHISSDEVYGALRAEDPPVNEQHAYAPRSPYAASKASSDFLVRAYGHTYDLPITISNCSNNFGPFQFPEKLMPLMILNAMSGESLPIYGDGSQIRDWIYVDDHSAAVWAILQKGRVGETYNVAGDNQYNNKEIVEMICSLLDKMLPASSHSPHKQLITFVDDRPGHDFRYALDTSKITPDLGWHPHETLQSGLRKTIAWYLENEAWVSQIKQRPAYQEWIEENYLKRAEGG